MHFFEKIFSTRNLIPIPCLSVEGYTSPPFIDFRQFEVAWAAWKFPKLAATGAGIIAEAIFIPALINFVPYFFCPFNVFFTVETIAFQMKLSRSKRNLFLAKTFTITTFGQFKNNTYAN